MNASISIETQGNKVAVKSPYHPAFIAEARKLNGKWSAGAWHFDVRDRERAQALCREVYGTAGEPTALANVRVNLSQLGYLGPACYAIGRLIVERKARDYSAKLGDGVVVIEGGFPSSGGSMKNPSVDAHPGTVLEVRDVPLVLAEAAVKESPEVYSFVTVTPVVGTEAEPDPDADLIELVRGLSDERLEALDAVLRAEMSRRAVAV